MLNVRLINIRLRPWITLLFTLVMLLWAGHSLARLFWILMPSPDTSAPGSAQLSGFLPTYGLLSNIDTMAVRQAFVLTDAAGLLSLPDAVRSSSAADTRLQLVLRGAVVSSVSHQSQAIIAAGDEQRVYRPGDSIVGTVAGVRLVSVFNNFVTLDNNGLEERLRMYEPQGQIRTVEEVPGTSAVQAPEQLVPESSSLNNIIRLQVYQEDGRPRGLQIRHGSRVDILSAAGLQVGDLITAIDGEPVTDVMQLPALIARLEQSEALTLRIARDDTELIVNLNRASLRLP